MVNFIQKKMYIFDFETPSSPKQVADLPKL